MEEMMYDAVLYREIDELPTLAVGQADDLKIDTAELSVAVTYPDGVDRIRVWTHRPTWNYVNVERLVAGRWVAGTEEDVAIAVAAARRDGML